VTVRTRSASRLAGFGTTIFTEMSALAERTGSINLGQGFPDTDGPSEVLDAAIEAIRTGVNQYPPGPGAPALRQAIGANDALRTGAYSTTVTFTLSTTNP